MWRRSAITSASAAAVSGRRRCSWSAPRVGGFLPLGRGAPGWGGGGDRCLLFFFFCPRCGGRRRWVGALAVAPRGAPAKLRAGGLTRADCHVRARRRRSLVVSIALLAGHTPTRVGGGRGGGDRPAVGRLGCGVPDAVHGSLPVTSLLLTTTHRLGPPLRFGGQRQAQCNAGTRPIYKLYIPRAQCKQSKTLQHPRTHPSPPPPPPQTNDPTRGNSSRRGAHPRPTRPPPAPDATAWQSKGQ